MRKIEEEGFNLPKTLEKNESRREQFLDSGFNDWSMQLLERDVFGEKITTPDDVFKALDNLVKQIQTENAKK